MPSNRVSNHERLVFFGSGKTLSETNQSLYFDFPEYQVTYFTLPPFTMLLRFIVLFPTVFFTVLFLRDKKKFVCSLMELTKLFCCSLFSPFAVSFVSFWCFWCFL